MKSVKILIITSALFLSFFVVLLSFRLAAFDIDIYKNEFVKNNVDVENRENISADLIFFLKDSRAGEEKISAFNEEEKQHLTEVKGIIQGMLLFMYSCLALSVVCLSALFFAERKKFRKNFGKFLLISGIISVCIASLFVMMTLFFDSSFILFHELFFKSVWQFPADSLLIRLFPQEFFFGMFARIISFSLVSAFVMLATGYALKNRLSRK